MSDNVTPIQPKRLLVSVGGQVDEFRVSLGIYGVDLDPARLTEELSVVPTSTARKGERRGNRSPAASSGSWIYSREGKSPSNINDILKKILAEFSRNGANWSSLAERFKLQFRIGIHSCGWNRGFGLNPDVLAAIAATGASLEFDLYFHGEADDP